MKNLTLKLCAIAVLCLAFMIGMLFVSGLVDERQRYHQEVISQIKEAHVGELGVATPFILVQTDVGNYPIFASHSQIVAHADVQDDQYQRGIYHAISFNGKLNIEQNFALEALTNLLKNPPANSPLDTPPDKSANKTTNKTLKKTPTITGLKFIIAVSDLRGTVPTNVQINGKTYLAKFASGDMPFYHLQADISPTDISELLVGGKLSVALTLPVMGIDSLTMLPLGEQFDSRLNTNWSELKFFGQALPSQKNIGKQGTHAIWQPNFIAQDNQKIIIDCLKESCSSLSLENSGQWLGTAFVKMDDTYTKTDRTIKYALLLVLICFGTFFLFETLKGLRIHPIQYGLVAGSLLLFYVLLLSLAEHIAFGLSYLIASVACVGLIGWYTCYVLSGVKRGLTFMLILGTLYGGFYVVLSVSGFNLLLGALFCFVLLALVMYLTRHIDWYQIGKPTKTQG